MTNEYVFSAGVENTPKRLDVFLSETDIFLSRSEVKKIIKNGLVFVNAQQAKPSLIINEDDEIRIKLNEDFSPEIVPENIALDIVYEDNNLAVINKPKNMLTHPTNKEMTGSLVNALLNRYGYEGLSGINGIMRPGIVHRLDRNTTGLLLIAKNDKTHEYLAEKIKTKEIKRNYRAVVHGNFEQTEGTVNLPIGRNPKKPEQMSVVENGKPSVTHYKVIEEFKGYSYIELSLETGRTHQIRVHMFHIGHPVVNDSLYNKTGFKVKTTEQVLQSYKLEFAEPEKNDIIKLEINPDRDIEKVIKYLRSLIK